MAKFLLQLSGELDATEDQCRELCGLLFNEVAQKLDYSAYVQFAIRLPSPFQKSVLSFPHGVDRGLTVDSLVAEAARVLQSPPEQARSALRSVWEHLNRVSGSREFETTLAQLPAEMVQLLAGTAPPPVEIFRGSHNEWTDHRW